MGQLEVCRAAQLQLSKQLVIRIHAMLAQLRIHFLFLPAFCFVLFCFVFWLRCWERGAVSECTSQLSCINKLVNLFCHSAMGKLASSAREAADIRDTEWK